MDPGPESPCIRLCVIDPISGFCIGCGRKGEEIAAWLSLSLAERRAINATLPARLAQMTKRELRQGRTRRRSASS